MHRTDNHYITNSRREITDTLSLVAALGPVDNVPPRWGSVVATIFGYLLAIRPHHLSKHMRLSIVEARSK